jgi:hypothetical protein
VLISLHTVVVLHLIMLLPICIVIIIFGCWICLISCTAFFFASLFHLGFEMLHFIYVLITFHPSS